MIRFTPKDFYSRQAGTSSEIKRKLWYIVPVKLKLMYWSHVCLSLSLISAITGVRPAKIKAMLNTELHSFFKLFFQLWKSFRPHFWILIWSKFDIKIETFASWERNFVGKFLSLKCWYDKNESLTGQCDSWNRRDVLERRRLTLLKLWELQKHSWLCRVELLPSQTTFGWAQTRACRELTSPTTRRYNLGHRVTQRINADVIWKPAKNEKLLPECFALFAKERREVTNPCIFFHWCLKFDWLQVSSASKIQL